MLCTCALRVGVVLWRQNPTGRTLMPATASTDPDMLCPVTGIPCIYHVQMDERTCFVMELRICSLECANHWAAQRGREVHAEHRVDYNDLFGNHHEYHYRTRRRPAKVSESSEDKAWGSRFSALESALRIHLKKLKEKREKPPD